MSHDQKPSKVRLVSTGAIGGPASGPASAAPPATASAGDTAPPTKAGLPPIVLAMLFILGCALGGAALPMLHLI
jgi:hypothetical protein